MYASTFYNGYLDKINLFIATLYSHCINVPPLCIVLFYLGFVSPVSCVLPLLQLQLVAYDRFIIHISRLLVLLFGISEYGLLFLWCKWGTYLWRTRFSSTWSSFWVSCNYLLNYSYIAALPAISIITNLFNNCTFQADILCYSLYTYLYPKCTNP